MPNKLAVESIEAVHAYWASTFGCPASSVRPSRTLVVPTVDAKSIYAMTFGGHPIVAVPSHIADRVTSTLSEWTAETITDPGAALASLQAVGTIAIGPAWLGYGDANISPGDTAGTRMLDASDAGAVDELRRECPPVEWEHGGSTFGDDPMAGRFVDSTLVALAGYETWGGSIAHIAVVTHPAFRGRGHGRAVVSRIAQHALEQGLVLQYRTLERNAASRHIADSLGFTHMAASLTIRLRPDLQLPTTR